MNSIKRDALSRRELLCIKIDGEVRPGIWRNINLSIYQEAHNKLDYFKVRLKVEQNITNILHRVIYSVYRPIIDA